MLAINITTTIIAFIANDDSRQPLLITGRYGERASRNLNETAFRT